MILDAFNLEGKVALVTGSSRGLGQAMALGLAEAGADIVSLSRQSDCDDLKKMVQELGGRFDHIEFDLGQSSPEQLQRIVLEIENKFGHLDLLVNNAGIIRRSPAIEFSERDWDQVIDINQKSMFFLSQAAAKQMIPRGKGKIINIASMLSYQGGILVPAYTAAKSAVLGLTRALANEWAGKGINVNAIAPGYMATENTAPLRSDPDRNQGILDRIPAGRWGEPRDLKGAVVFLASSASDYLHGASIPVDGGWLSS